MEGDATWFELIRERFLVSGAKALSGDLAGWNRLRTGDYRIRFYVKGDNVVIDKIGHRSDFYED